MTVFVMQLQSNLKSIEELISQSRWSYKKPRTVNYRYNQITHAQIGRYFSAIWNST